MGQGAWVLQRIQEILVDKGTDIYLEAEGIQEIQERISRIKVVCEKLLASELTRFEKEEVDKIRKNFEQMFSAYERYLMAMTPEKRTRRDGRRTRTEKQYPVVKCDLYDIAITFRDEEIAKGIKEVEKKYRRR